MTKENKLKILGDVTKAIDGKEPCFIYVLVKDGPNDFSASEYANKLNTNEVIAHLEINKVRHIIRHIAQNGDFEEGD